MKLSVGFLLILVVFRRGLGHPDRAETTPCDGMMSSPNDETTSICSADYTISTETSEYVSAKPILGKYCFLDDQREPNEHRTWYLLFVCV